MLLPTDTGNFGKSLKLPTAFLQLENILSIKIPWSGYMGNDSVIFSKQTLDRTALDPDQLDPDQLDALDPDSFIW